MATPAAIDRQALVSRHNPVLKSMDLESPLSVGNGEFAFTVDATGLQTFAEPYDQTIPLGTMSQWGWHKFPNPSNFSPDTFKYTDYESHGRKVPYNDQMPRGENPEAEWLRANPHRLHLGRVGLRLTKGDGTAAAISDLSNITQTLDLFSGVIRSQFTFDGQVVNVTTVCHPKQDAIAVRVESPLVTAGRLAIDIKFPYGAGDKASTDWTKPDQHKTEWTSTADNSGTFKRTLDFDRYFGSLVWSTPVKFETIASHEFRLTPTQGNQIEFTLEFTQKEPAGQTIDYLITLSASVSRWKKFWTTGGAIDFTGSTDPRATELERRVILSQYLTAIQCAGSLPPAETALTFNSWFGKFHLEMHWWHSAHFAQWNRIELLERSLDYYGRILPSAQKLAKKQGYTGARWPKMTDPMGADSPSPVGPFLVWQQPHPIYYAELSYRAHPNKATLDKHAQVVSETAEFMASLAWWDEKAQRYVLGPPLHLAQETYPKAVTINATYELTYWIWGLETAQAWRERAGQPRNEKWDHVIAHLSKPTVQDGQYLAAESATDTYTNPKFKTDHPAVLMALGWLPGKGIDREVMRGTLHWVMTNWTWDDTWGWDFPMVAMTAARLGEGDVAIDALLMKAPKNIYRVNGHNSQSTDRLPIYLPGNGGILSAVAMMAAGWDGGPEENAPGFPKEKWTVRHENLRKMI